MENRKSARRRALAGSIMASVALVFSSTAVLLIPPAAAGAVQSPHGLTSPPTVTASNWHPTTTHDPSPGFDPTPLSASCVTSTFCVDVGYYSTGSVTYPLIQQWSGAVWSTVVPTVTDTFDYGLSGVSCVSITFCEAVGTYTSSNSSPELPVALVWNGSTWTSQTVNLPPGQAQEDLQDVSCASPTNCVAVGQQLDASDNAQPSSEVWNGSQWSAVSTPAIFVSTDDILNSISCTSTLPSWCMAVGTQQTSTTITGLSELWNGSTWTLVPNVTLALPTLSRLNSVSCTGPSFCAAVGFHFTTTGDQTTYRTLAEMWNGSSWSVSASPNLGGSNGDSLYGVSCVAATSCSAVGTYWLDSSGDTNLNEALVWNGASWSEGTPANNPVPPGPFEPSQASDGVSCLADWACMSVGWSNSPSGFLSWNTQSLVARSGYRFVASDGGVFNYGVGAPFLGSLGATHLNAPIVGIGVMPAGDGYYLVASDGGVFAYGSAQFFGSMGGKPLNKPIVGMAVTPDGAGYWLVASDGGVFAFGDAAFFGSAGALTLNKPVVGIASTPNGMGYWIVASDGGIFNYGPATSFLGSTGALHLNKPIVGIGATTSGQYYLVASDGGIFAFPGGAAGPPFYGSTGAMTLNKPIVGMTVLQGGYYLSGSDGGIFAYPTGAGGLPFFGSTGGTVLNAPIVGMAS